jgi:SAM-dependent methyltransferase
MKDDVTTSSSGDDPRRGAPRARTPARRALHPSFPFPGMLGPASVIPAASGLKGLYLRLFGVPDVRVQLSAGYALAAARAAAPRTVLDLGCGNGMITCLLARHLPECRFVGVDLDGDGIGFGTRLAGQNGLENVSFRVADAERDELPGPNEFVVSLAVFQFIEDVSALLDRLHGVLAPGGTLALQLTSASSTQYLTRFARMRGAVPTFKEARGGFTEDGIRAALEAAGFEVVHMRGVIKGPTILAKEIFYAALSAGGPARYVLGPILNWVTAFDRWYPGRGNGIFLVARRSW